MILSFATHSLTLVQSTGTLGAHCVVCTLAKADMMSAYMVDFTDAIHQSHVLPIRDNENSNSLRRVKLARPGTSMCIAFALNNAQILLGR
jgi:hypothetical protein